MTDLSYNHVLSYHLSVQQSQLHNKMGQCMQLKTNSTIYHPLLGPLQEMHKDDVALLVLSFPIINQEEYISLSKDIHKLKYNLELKEHLYLPLSESFIKNSLFCETVNKLELSLPIYQKNLEEIMQESARMNNRFTQLEIWYLLLISTKYLRHFSKKGNPKNLDPSHFIVFADGSLKIIPEVLIPKLEVNSQILNLSRSLKKISSESTASGQGELSAIYKLGLICLTAATFASYQQLHNLSNGSNLARKEKIHELLSNCKQSYTASLVDVLSVMLLEERETDKSTIEMVYNKAGQYQSQIKIKLQLGIPFGEFDSETLRQTNKMFELGTPKHSRIGPQSEYHKHSFDMKDNQDGQEGQDVVLEKIDQIASPADNYLTIL